MFPNSFKVRGHSFWPTSLPLPVGLGRAGQILPGQMVLLSDGDFHSLGLFALYPSLSQGIRMGILWMVVSLSELLGGLYISAHWPLLSHWECGGPLLTSPVEVC